MYGHRTMNEPDSTEKEWFGTALFTLGQNTGSRRPPSSPHFLVIC